MSANVGDMTFEKAYSFRSGYQGMARGSDTPKLPNSPESGQEQYHRFATMHVETLSIWHISSLQDTCLGDPDPINDTIGTIQDRVALVACELFGDVSLLD